MGWKGGNPLITIDLQVNVRPCPARHATPMTWCKAIAVAQIQAGEVVASSCNGHDIAIYRTVEGYFATADLCTHAHARMSEGYLDDCFIECPLHGARFDVRNGAVAGPPATVPLRTYPTKVDDGWVVVDVSDAE